MKTVIEGKVYDTATADFIDSYENTTSYSDYSHYKENLYLTKKGQYFLFGHGGPASPYAKYHLNSATKGRKIKLLDEQQALTWAEENDCAVEVIMKYWSIHEG